MAEDWELYFSIDSIDGSIAKKIENHIKAMKSRKYIQNLATYPEIAEKLIFKFSA